MPESHRFCGPPPKPPQPKNSNPKIKMDYDDLQLSALIKLTNNNLSGLIKLATNISSLIKLANTLDSNVTTVEELIQLIKNSSSVKHQSSVGSKIIINNIDLSLAVEDIHEMCTNIGPIIEPIKFHTHKMSADLHG